MDPYQDFAGDQPWAAPLFVDKMWKKPINAYKCNKKDLFKNDKIVVVIEQRHYGNYTNKVCIWYHVILCPPSSNGCLFLKKVTLCPLSRNVCLLFDKITSLSPPPQNVRLFRKFVISSLPRKNPMVWNNFHYISDAILPKNTRPNYSVTICRLTFR